MTDIVKDLSFKQAALVILSFILGVMISAAFLRLFPRGSDAASCFLLWFFVGACFIPKDGLNEEWQYWIYSPLCGLCRFLLNILRKIFGT